MNDLEQYTFKHFFNLFENVRFALTFDRATTKSAKLTIVNVIFSLGNTRKSMDTAIQTKLNEDVKLRNHDDKDKDIKQDSAQDRAHKR